MGIETLIKALPASGIESQILANLIFTLEGKEATITFLEPPAGQRVPFVDPVEAMAILLRADGIAPDKAYYKAAEGYAHLRPELPLLERPRLYCDGEVVKVPECVVVPRLLAFLKDRAFVSRKLLDFIANATDETCRAKIFHGRDYDKDVWRLDELPNSPLPKQMIEFFTGIASDIAWAIAPDGSVDGQLPPALLAWRESMMPIAKELEQILGEEVFYFQNLDDDRDDDWCHRFFVLHSWCSLLPESTFVRYLLEATRLPNVQALKSELLAPESFKLHPFEFKCEFVGIEATPCHFRYEKDT